MKASLKNYRQSPRKVRGVGDLIKGKTVASALSILAHAPKRATQAIEKTLRSAVANAHALGAPTENLIIEDIRVDEGRSQKRLRPQSRGRGMIVKKRSSHISITLGNKKQESGIKNQGKSTQVQ